MEILKSSVAGTMESSDIMVTLEPLAPGSIEPGDATGKPGTNEIELKSLVENQFGRQIRAVIARTLEELQVTNVRVIAVDKGALDCTIQARVKTAVYRAAGVSPREWRVPK